MDPVEFCKRASHRRVSLALAAVLLLLALPGSAVAKAVAHASAHAPIGVMADHTHPQGETMFSYRYMRMGMNGLRDEDERISRSRVLQDFMVTPTRMDMEMHMFGFMHSPADGFTLMVMVPLVRLEMEHRTGMGGMFTTRSDGVGDIAVSALIDLWSQGHHKVHAELGLSFPSGSITEQDRTPMSGAATVRIPYPMQLGSGTYDFMPGLTYTGHAHALSWGAQARGEIRMNENHAGYRLGDEYRLTGWGALEVAKWLSASLRAEWRHNLNIRGRDESSSINPMVVPTADPDSRASQRLDVLAGVNLIAPEGALAGVRLAIEAGLPVYQRLDGPGLETDWITTVGVQYAF